MEWTKLSIQLGIQLFGTQCVHVSSTHKHLAVDQEQLENLNLQAKVY